MNSSISFLSVLHNEKNIVNVSFPLKGFSFAVSTADIKMLAKATAIFVRVAVPCVLEIVFAVELKRVLLKNKFKDSSEGLGGDRVVSP